MTRFIIQMEGGLEPIVHGPYASEQARDYSARSIHRNMDEDDNLISLDVYSWPEIPGDGNVRVEAGTWSNGFFEED